MANAHARKVVGQWHRQQLAHQVVPRLMATIQRCRNITTHKQRKRRILSQQHNAKVGEIVCLSVLWQMFLIELQQGFQTK